MEWGTFISRPLGTNPNLVPVRLAVEGLLWQAGAAAADGVFDGPA